MQRCVRSALSNNVKLFSKVVPAETLTVLFLHFQFLYILTNPWHYLAFIFYQSLRCDFGNSLVDQWLRLGTSTAVAQVQSLVRERRSCKPHGAAKKQKKRCDFNMHFSDFQWPGPSFHISVGHLCFFFSVTWWHVVCAILCWLVFFLLIHSSS